MRVTLRDAAQYVIKLPKVERKFPHWETAIECLMLVGEHEKAPVVGGGFVCFRVSRR
jgi:hypothetical protein